MIYTIGRTTSYERAFRGDFKCPPHKMGREKDSVGGSVWETFEEALAHTDLEYSVYGVEADWDKDTVPSKNGDWNNLLVTSTLIRLPFFELTPFVEKNTLIPGVLPCVCAVLPNIRLEDSPVGDFCKYAFIEPWNVGYTGPSTVAEITSFNKNFLWTGYSVRKNDDAEELPYLSRAFPQGCATPAPCKCIAVVLYSGEQLRKEGIKTMAHWGVVSVQAEPEWGISPMTPETIIRNALGSEFGGNGVPIDRDYYEASVAYWNKWAVTK